MKTTTLEFKWTVSRGRDTYGYNICTLYADGVKVARCNGGGYDMEGTCLGSYLESAFADRLRQLKPADMPAQSHWQPDDTRVCDGKCADESRPRVMPRLPRDTWKCPVCGGSTRSSGDGKRVDDGRYFGGLVFADPKYNPLDAKLQKADGTFTKPEDEGKTYRELQKAGKIVDLDLIRTWYAATSKHATERHTRPSIDGACGKLSVEQIGKAIGLSFEYVPVRSKKLNVYWMHDSRDEEKIVSIA